MTHDPARLRYLFTQYANNLCTREEMNELFTLIESAANDSVLRGELLKVWNDSESAPMPSGIDQHELYQEIYCRIAGNKVKIIQTSWFKAAAAVIAVCLVTILYFSIKPFRAQPLADNSSIHKDTTSIAHKLITLPDGSTVLLNNHSSLDFPSQFNGSIREVTLKGEGYFDIERDESKPFIIHTGAVKTKVLGTAFNIRAYPDEPEVTVTVTKGKVKVETENRTLGILTPNQRISFNKNSTAALRQNVLADTILIWKRNDLVFDNISFKEAADAISKRYHVDIVFANTGIEKCTFTASFLNENSIDQVMTVLCDLNKATYEKKNNVITIKGEGCN